MKKYILFLACLAGCDGVFEPEAKHGCLAKNSVTSGPVSWDTNCRDFITWKETGKNISIFKKGCGSDSGFYLTGPAEKKGDSITFFNKTYAFDYYKNTGSHFERSIFQIQVEGSWYLFHPDPVIAKKSVLDAEYITANAGKNKAELQERYFKRGTVSISSIRRGCSE